MQHSRRSGSCSSRLSSSQPSGNRHPCSRHHAAQPSSLRPGSSSSFWFMQLPMPTGSGRHHLRHPFGRRFPMVGRHQDKVETVAAVIPATLENVHFLFIFVSSIEHNSLILLSKPCSPCSRQSMENIPSWSDCLFWKTT